MTTQRSDPSNYSTLWYYYALSKLDMTSVTGTHSKPTQINPDGQNRLPRLIPRKKAPSQKPLPIPDTPKLPPPPDISNLVFQKPTRRILSSHDHDIFLSSPTYSLILSFVFSLSESAVDKKISSIHVSTTHSSTHNILSILNSIEETISHYPPTDQGGSRFGNSAFRNFIDSISKQSPSWHKRLDLPSQSSIEEASTYLDHS